MEIRLQKWGNSDGIRIPHSFFKSLGLQTNDLLDIREEGDKIIITKAKKKDISLEERIQEYDGNNLCKEFEWDKASGKELYS